MKKYKAPEKIYVTQPALPELEEFMPYLEKIWQSRCLTNMGNFHHQLEQALKEYLGVKHVSVFCNGMSALQVGLQALHVTGEVITTPYSFVATTHAIFLNGCTPVFCDIDERTLNIDPEKIESLITPRTTAILAVHVYGTPCNLPVLEIIAKKNGLKLFYDAAHAFGVKQNKISILNYGDLSMLSFHATKIFNTFEGGALVTNDIVLKNKIDLLKNFGISDDVTIELPGINGKMDEFRAAFGLLQLKHVDRYIKDRMKIDGYYRTKLSSVKGVRILETIENVKYNYAYFPVFITDEYGMTRNELYEKLKTHGIFGRRYFYPLISNAVPYRDLPSADMKNLPTAVKIAEQVICLPIYPGLRKSVLDKIICLISGPK